MSGAGSGAEFSGGACPVWLFPVLLLVSSFIVCCLLMLLLASSGRAVAARILVERAVACCQ